MTLTVFISFFLTTCKSEVIGMIEIYTNLRIIRCLYFNARSSPNKTTQSQTLVYPFEIIGITKTWLRVNISNCEFLSGNNFTIHKKNSADQIGRGAMVAINQKQYP